MNQRNAQNVPWLDGWRGLAICSLLLGHFFPVPGINFGAVGVNLFFVLSGLLMGRLLFVDRVPIQQFYRRRISRVFPTMYAFIAVVIVAYLVAGAALDWRDIGAAVTVTTNYFPGVPGHPAMPFGHIWSLAVEEHSYVLLALVALGERAGLLRARLVVGLLALAWAACGLWYWLAYPRASLPFDRWLHTEVSAFGIFASAWLAVRLHGRSVPRLPLALFGALCLAGVAAHWWRVPLPATLVVGVGALALAVNLLGGAPPAVLRLLSLAPLRQAGLMSFSLYLWQQPFYLLVHHKGWHPVPALALALGAGVASYYLLEKPARAWLNRHWGRRRPADQLPSYAPMSSARTTGLTAPEARCLYTAPGLRPTPDGE